MPEIIVDIHPDGTVTKTVNGIKGAECQTHPASVALDKVLGPLLSEQKTPDYYEPATTCQHQTQHS